ncbi:MAG: hypothetical protein OXC66_03740 [Roseovarius sp.]|nr:hypothetical protein [Roseovarius sp.]
MRNLDDERRVCPVAVQAAKMAIGGAEQEMSRLTCHVDRPLSTSAGIDRFSASRQNRTLAHSRRKTEIGYAAVVHLVCKGWLQPNN